MLVIRAGETASRSEQRFVDALADQPGGVCLTNFTARSGTRAPRDVDGLVITPTGCYVVEVKGTARSGEVKTPPDWPWRVGGEEETFHLHHGNPGRQANLNAKVVKSAVGHQVNPGFVQAAVLVDGPDLHLAQNQRDSGGCAVMLMDEFAAGERPRFKRKSRISVDTARGILTALGVPDGDVPTVEALIAQGFEVSPEVGPATTQPSRKTLAARRERERQRKTRDMLADIPPRWRQVLFPDRALFLWPVLLPVYMLPYFIYDSVFTNWIDYGSEYAVMTFSLGSLIWLAGALRARIGAFMTLPEAVFLFAYPILVVYVFRPNRSEPPELVAADGFVGWAFLMVCWAVSAGFASRAAVEISHQRRVKRAAAEPA